MDRVERFYAAHKDTGSDEESGLASQSIQETTESADSSFKKYLQEHGFPKLRELHIALFFGHHETAHDAEILAPHLKSADVFIPELVSYFPEEEKILQSIAKGSASSSDVRRMQHSGDHGYWNAIIKIIQGSSLKIGIADLQSGEAGTYLSKTDDLVNFIVNEIPDRHWSRVAARQIYTRRLEKSFEATVEREKQIVSGICPAIVRAFAGDETRSTRESLKVLMFMGSYHAPALTLVSAMNQFTERISPEGSDVLSFGREIEKLIRAKLPIPEQLSDAALTEELVKGLLLSTVKGQDVNPALGVMVREAAEAMGDDERETFHNYFMNGDIPGAFKFFQTIAERLAREERKKDEAEE